MICIFTELSFIVEIILMSMLLGSKGIALSLIEMVISTSLVFLTTSVINKKPLETSFISLRFSIMLFLSIIVGLINCLSLGYNSLSVSLITAILFFLVDERLNEVGR